MTLPTSGPLSLGNIQTEFGGSNPISISEYRRGAGLPILVPDTATNINIKSTLSNMAFSNYRGGSVVSILDTQTVYVGYAEISQTQEGVTTYTYAIGYRQDIMVPTGGSVSDGTSNIYGGATIRAICVDWDSPGAGSLMFRVNGTQTNSGWTSITVNGTTFNRASASSFTAGGTFTTWTWDIFSPFLGPFAGTAGTNVTVTWN